MNEITFQTVSANSAYSIVSLGLRPVVVQPPFNDSEINLLVATKATMFSLVLADGQVKEVLISDKPADGFGKLHSPMTGWNQRS
jgi:hypothetical protein